MLRSIFPLAALLMLAVTPAHAISFNVGPVHFDSKKPLDSPVDPIKVGPVTIEAPSLKPGSLPSVTVEGNGEIAKAVNTTDQVAHIPEQARDEVEHNSEVAVKKGIHDVGDAIAKPFQDLGDWVNRKVDQAKDDAVGVLTEVAIYAVIGLLAVIFASMLLGTIITSLVVRSGLKKMSRKMA